MAFVATPGLRLPSLAMGFLGMIDEKYFGQRFSRFLRNTPQIRYMGHLFTKEEQATIDAEWLEKNPQGNNGVVFAAEVSEDGRIIKIRKTSFAARQSRGKEIKGISIPEFKTVNIASFGVTRDGSLMSGYHKRAEADYPFAGILDIKSLVRHAKREVREESGLKARSMRIVGIVFDEKTVNFVVLFDAPTEEKCKLSFQKRNDPDEEMGYLVFYPQTEEGIKGVLSRRKSWPYMEEALLAALHV
jgi:hypothetical protein